MKQQRKLLLAMLFMAWVIVLPGIGSLEAKAAKKEQYFTSDSIFYHTVSNRTVEVCGVGKKKKTLEVPGSVRYKGKKYTVVGIAAHESLHSYRVTAEGSVGAERMETNYTYKRKDGKKFPKGLRPVSNSFVEKVVLPSTLKYIGTGAFAGCAWLKEVQFAKSYKKLTVGENAFNETGIKSISFPKGTYEIGAYATGQIASITIPASVKKIGVQVVNGATKKVSISKNNKNYKIKSGVLYTKDEKTLVGVSGSVKNVKVSDKTTEIGQYAFAWSWVESVALNGRIKEIPQGAFMECIKLKKVTETDSVTEISYGAFGGDFRLTTIGNIPNVKKIGMAAFWDCEKLSLGISSEMDIDDNAFGGTEIARYANIIVPQGDAKYTIQNGCLIKTEGDKKIVIKIENMKKIVVPEGVTDVAVYLGGINEVECEEIVLPASLVQQRGSMQVESGAVITYKGSVPPKFGEGVTIHYMRNRVKVFKPIEIVIPKGSMELYKNAFKFNEELDYLIWEIGELVIKEL